MDICEHCHNVLAKSIDRCTVCGTLRADPFAADVRRRETGTAPSHAPGWAAPKVTNGLHPDDFLRELTGEDPVAPPAEEPTHEPTAAVLPPRPATPAPATGALAGYLGSSVTKRPDTPTAGDDTTTPPPPTGQPAGSVPPEPRPDPHATELTTARKLTPDGVAARSTRLDGSVKLGPTPNHSVIAVGAPVLAALLVVLTIVLSYRVGDSEAAAENETAAPIIDTGAVTQSSSAVVLLELDGCGVLDQVTGFLFADQAILVPRSATLTDDRPTVVTSDGTSHQSEIVGWSLTRDLAVIRAEERLSGGLRWGVSGRSSAGDVVSILTVTGPGVAAPVPASIASVDTTNGIVTAFELDVRGTAGSVVLNADGYVIGIIDADGTAHVSDDVSPAVSRIVLANERPAAVCPPPPPTTLPTPDGETDDEGTAADK